ncbi:uroporphyrinogen-III C-methyltransferase [Bacillus sp. FJAT-45350]|uniref:uroporphyrinogen-III C-methyltransferase n=1 Tax=Bacillus sp. FJAT-45350 TaxID=2011014 RepID=UPI000BB68EDC|nr:uroporphyrinogen-III C-methyltransferase [Bacillus sp. FJAT-45350]
MKNGKVYLVGAGPGDIQLLTVKGLECIKKADVILYDRLVNPLLLEYAPANTELIYCGKLPDRHIVRQEAINDLLVEKGKEGKVVVRLKGGDPCVFGRVGEEAEALTENDIEYEIVPGITAGIAASTYAGIPVTHREHGSSFAVVAGHNKSEEGKPTIDWESLSKGVDTIAFYMGIGNLNYITNQLISCGRRPSTPVILIQWGTYGRQKTLEGTLETISRKVEELNFQNPAITLVGDIVSLREKLQWFEKKPLFGKHILLARTGTEQGKLAPALIENGAEVFEFPRFILQSQIKEKQAEEVIEKVTQYNQIVFTSPESVNQFFKALSYYKVDIRMIEADFYGGSVKSLRALETFGCIAHLVETLTTPAKLLVIGEEQAVAKMDRLVEKWGNAFDYLVTHKIEYVSQSSTTFKLLDEDKRINTIVFPSAESIPTLLEKIAELYSEPLSFFQDKKVITFGEKSSDAAGKLGINVDHKLEEPTVEALISALTVVTIG